MSILSRSDGEPASLGTCPPILISSAMKQTVKQRANASPGDSPQKNEGRRGALVRAAYELVAEKGLEGLRTRDIAAKVGINISTLHYHFATKQELLIAMATYVGELFNSLKEPLPTTSTSLDQLHQIFRSGPYREKAEPYLDVVYQELMLRARRDEGVREAFQASHDAWHNVVESILDDCVRDDYLRSDLDTRLATSLLTSFVIGADMQGHVREGGARVQETYDQLMTWMLKS